jgi:cytochrome c oxidase assembly protein subunit 15
VTGRVEEDPECGSWLVRVLDRAKLDHRRLGRVEIIDDHIDVHLLGNVLRRPGRRDVIRHLLEADAIAVIGPDLRPALGDLGLAAAVVPEVRAGEGAGPPRALVRADLRIVAMLLAGVTGLMLVAGTVVTGTGPLAGTIIDSNGHRSTVPRFHFTLQSVTQLHADVGWFLGALAVALVIGMRYGGAPARVVRLGWIVLAGLTLQGVIGYVQYLTHLPAGLVWVHVAASVMLWILVVRLVLSTRERVPLAPEPVTGPVFAAEPPSAS